MLHKVETFQTMVSRIGNIWREVLAGLILFGSFALACWFRQSSERFGFGDIVVFTVIKNLNLTPSTFHEDGVIIVLSLVEGGLGALLGIAAGAIARLFDVGIVGVLVFGLVAFLVLQAALSWRVVIG